MGSMPTPLRRAHIYLARGKPSIVAAMHFNSAGIYFEQEDPFVSEASDWGELGMSLDSSLSRFSFREANLRDSMKTDWPSFRSSRCRSVREFEEIYLRIAVCALNDSELLYDACCQPRGESDITFHVTLNPYAANEETNRLLKRLFNASQRWATISDSVE